MKKTFKILTILSLCFVVSLSCYSQSITVVTTPDLDGNCSGSFSLELENDYDWSGYDAKIGQYDAESDSYINISNPPVTTLAAQSFPGCYSINGLTGALYNIQIVGPEVDDGINIDGNGVYIARRSSMFPQSWSESKILEEIANARRNMKSSDLDPTTGIYSRLNSEGTFKIGMYINGDLADMNSPIGSAFPQL